MGLLLCFVCGHQKEAKPIKKGANYVCGNCGAKEILIIRSKSYARFVAWMDKDGCNAEKAFHELYGELEGIRQHRGYAKGWTYHKFKKITGRSPNGEAVETARPASHGLLQWIGKQNAAYARRKREEDGLVNVGNRVPVRGVNDVDGASSLMNDDDWGVKL